MHQKINKTLSPQKEIHKDLQKAVDRALKNPYEKPFRSFSKKVFKVADALVQKSAKNVILDSGCGTGESSLELAIQNPEELVIGIDRSASRLKKFEFHKKRREKKLGRSIENVAVFRGDLVDFWRLIGQNKWPVLKHYILYPNPYPKPMHLRRRWHGHPVFPALCKIGKYLEVRSDWKLYLKEFSKAHHFVDQNRGTLQEVLPQNARPLSSFENKYFLNERAVFRLFFENKES